MKNDRTSLIKEIAFATSEFGSVQKYLAPRLDALVGDGDLDEAMEIISEEVEAAGGTLPASFGRRTLTIYRTIMAEAPWAWELYSYTVLEDSMGVTSEVRVATLEEYRATPKKLVKRTWRTIKGTRQDNSTNERAAPKQKAQDFMALAKSLAEMDPEEAEAVLAELIQDDELRSTISTTLREFRRQQAKAGSKSGRTRNPEDANPLDVVLKHLDVALGGADRGVLALMELGLTQEAKETVGGMLIEIITKCQEGLTLLGGTDLDSELEHLTKGTI